jgi:hypothetical protein
MLLTVARSAGLPTPAVVAWRSVASGAAFAVDPTSLVRIDSPGEDAQVDRLLRGAEEPAVHGELVGAARWYSGLLAGAARVAAAAGVHQMLNPVDDLAVLFDKRRCQAVLAAAGIPVPPALPTVRGYAELRSHMADAGWSRVFVKPAHGSSASGVLALSASGRRISAVTTVEPDGGRLFNALPVRRYTDEATVASIVDRLAPDGLHVERWFPQAGHDGHTVDLRVRTCRACWWTGSTRTAHRSPPLRPLPAGRCRLQRCRGFGRRGRSSAATTSSWSRCATTSRPTSRRGVARRTWSGTAWRRMGAASLAGQLHLRGAPRVLRRLPADADRAGAAHPAVRRPVPRQRHDRCANLGLRRSGGRFGAWHRPGTTACAWVGWASSTCSPRSAASCRACSPSGTGSLRSG